MLNAKVDDLGVIELARPVYDACATFAFGYCGHALRQGFVIRKRLRIFAVILHQDDLIVGIHGLLGDRHHAGIERLDVVLGGNHNAHQRRRLRQRIAHAVNKRRLGLLDRSVNAQRVKVTLQRKASGLDGIRLAICRAIGGRTGVHAPVIQHMSNMLKARARRETAKRQIIILGARDVFRRHANAIDKRLLHHQQMRHAVMAIEQVNVELCLKDRLTPLPRFLKHVLVTKQDLRTLPLCRLVQRGDIVEQRIRLQNVVVVQKCDVVARRLLNASVGVEHNAAVARQLNTMNPLVIGVGRKLGHRIPFGRGVHKQQFPVVIALR